MAGAVNGEVSLAERYDARAVALLRQAVRIGYTNGERLRKDPDLDALRRRNDFRDLLKNPDAKKP